MPTSVPETVLCSGLTVHFLWQRPCRKGFPEHRPAQVLRTELVPTWRILTQCLNEQRDICRPRGRAPGRERRAGGRARQASPSAGKGIQGTSCLNGPHATAACELKAPPVRSVLDGSRRRAPQTDRPQRARMRRWGRLRVCRGRYVTQGGHKAQRTGEGGLIGQEAREYLARGQAAAPPKGGSGVKAPPTPPPKKPSRPRPCTQTHRHTQPSIRPPTDSSCATLSPDARTHSLSRRARSSRSHHDSHAHSH